MKIQWRVKREMFNGVWLSFGWYDTEAQAERALTRLYALCPSSNCVIEAIN